jgi:hypothetical protein
LIYINKEGHYRMNKYRKITYLFFPIVNLPEIIHIK